MDDRTTDDGASWHVNDQVLWVVWSKTFVPFLKFGLRSDPITVSWVLASPGKDGWAEIAGPKGYPSSLIAASPLDLLRKAPSVPEVAARVAKRWAVASPPPKFGRLPLLLRGSASLQEWVAAGEAIVATRDYRTICADLRPVAPGHPADWLYYQRNPAAAERLRDFLGLAPCDGSTVCSAHGQTRTPRTAL